MRRVHIIALIGPLLIGQLLSSCNSCKRDGVDLSQELYIPDSVVETNQSPQVSKAVTEEMMQNISSPVETAALIKGLKIPFNKNYLASTDQAEKFNTNFEKALALGIYGCDLGYLNMYEKTSFVVDYISTIKRLADDIQVGQFFDFSTLKRLATNNENLDSLILISQQSFNRIDTYLSETNRSMFSAVIVAGVWVEGAYLSSRVAQISDHPRIRETIGEQKTIINFLMALLKVYEKDPNMAKLIEDFQPIKKAYDKVKITFELGEPEMVEENGVVTFKQTDKQIIEMDDQLYQELIIGIQDLRSKILKL
ncbi:MAG: hypothetical protein PWR03_438 [Tenuifilum sp.]|jgi:hypothetical protein|uniref:hypothetical protein n=1 Tax=Tenuifilum sp. TaxID=2760880 RepID=UPI0024AC3DEB|nr:hypothetical protein [Tenuifilum sp.]MDI3526255.1 hypothetical protein [Tenuifilum sp.]